MCEGKFPTRPVSLRAKEGVSSRDMSLSIGQNPGYISNSFTVTLRDTETVMTRTSTRAFQVKSHTRAT